MRIGGTSKRVCRQISVQSLHPLLAVDHLLVVSFCVISSPLNHFEFFSEFSSSIREAFYLLRILTKGLREKPGAINSKFGDETLFTADFASENFAVTL